MASTPSPSIRLFHAQGCHLCDRAREVLDRVGVPYESVDITGVAELEERYREWLPVVEIDGARAFVYYVDEAALRRKVSRT
ncbi:MAG TPA: glutaredoxin family protein [Gaiellaceae bacterium]|nr:glutaredoxin family protein [Gaiellaceae bacterium]